MPVVMHEHDQDAHLEHLGAVEQHLGPNPNISKVMTHAGTLPWPLSAPGYSRIPYAGRRHAHVSVQLDGAHVVLEPHARHGHRGHEQHVVQHAVASSSTAREPMEPRCFSKVRLDQESCASAVT